MQIMVTWSPLAAGVAKKGSFYLRQLCGHPKIKNGMTNEEGKNGYFSLSGTLPVLSPFPRKLVISPREVKALFYFLVHSTPKGCFFGSKNYTRDNKVCVCVCVFKSSEIAGFQSEGLSLIFLINRNLFSFIGGCIWGRFLKGGFAGCEILR